VAHRPAELVDVPEQGVAVGQPAARGDVVLQLREQPVGRTAAADLVQHVADVEEIDAHPRQCRVWHLHQPGRGQRAQDHAVAESAAGLLEVGFEQERQLAEPVRPLPAGLLQLGQPPTRRPAPRREQCRTQPDCQRRVTG
jgi:hypothetical protein